MFPRWISPWHNCEYCWCWMNRRPHQFEIHEQPVSYSELASHAALVNQQQPGAFRVCPGRTVVCLQYNLSARWFIPSQRYLANWKMGLWWWWEFYCVNVKFMYTYIRYWKCSLAVSHHEYIVSFVSLNTILYQLVRLILKYLMNVACSIPRSVVVPPQILSDVTIPLVVI